MQKLGVTGRNWSEFQETWDLVQTSSLAGRSHVFPGVQRMSYTLVPNKNLSHLVHERAYKQILKETKDIATDQMCGPHLDWYFNKLQICMTHAKIGNLILA